MSPDSSNGNGSAPNTSEFPYRFEIVPLDKMFVDESYQRPLTNFVDRIRSRFDPALVGTLVLSQRDGRKKEYAVIDGQTRWVAMTELGHAAAPCIVFTGLNQQQEAALFGKFQKERRGILSFHRFRADLVSGDEQAIAINTVVAGTGYVVGPTAKENMIPAVAALEAAYKRGPDVLERSLLVFREAWSHKDGQIKWMPAGSHIRGMSYFLTRPDSKDADDEHLARRLSVVSPEDLNRRASALREGGGHGGGSDRYMGDAIAGVYWKGKKRPKLVAA